MAPILDNPGKNNRKSVEAAKKGNYWESFKQWEFFSLKLDLIGIAIAAILIAGFVIWQLFAR